MWLWIVVGILSAVVHDDAAKPLAPCPDSPNCVSSLASDPEHAMPPLLYDLPEAEVMELLEEAVSASARTRVIERTPLYLHAEFRSRVFRFVDDVELRIDPEEHRIDFRSASRKGHYDFGVNRRRMETLCQRLLEHPGIRRAPRQ